MTTPPRSFPLLTGVAFLIAAVASAQTEHGGAPPSRRAVMQRLTPTVRMRPVHADLLLAEDAATTGKGPLRFGEPLETNLSLENSGVWQDLGNGDRLWRLRVESPGAYSLSLVFSRYQLPSGGELYVYDDRNEVVHGAYTDLENRLDGEFAIQPIRGDALTLEYFEPSRARGKSELVLGSVVHDYRNVLKILETDEPQDRAGGGAADFCEVDVICPLGAPWQDQINSTVHVRTSQGFLCSGVVLNNTANDGTILILAAAHCGQLTTGTFSFKFERTRCGRGVGPCTNVINGATQLVFDENLDVQLARLDAPPGLAFPIFAAGWDRSDTIPASTVTIHHPAGDEKKISSDDDPPTPFQNFWRISDWEAGVTEGGSSGGPMFDPAGRVIGILDSGSSTCEFPTDDDFSTRMAAAWPALEPYLDPAGTGQLTTDGASIGIPVSKPFDVTAVLPAEIVPLLPGLTRPVRVLGTGFTDATQIAIDGVGLGAQRMVRATTTSINIDMPQLHIGDHVMSVLENGVVKSVPFRIVEATEPTLQVATGSGVDRVISADGVDLLYSDKVGHVHYCYWSFSGIPSNAPRIHLAMGNNFTNLFGCRIDAIPASGWLKVHHTINNLLLPLGIKVYTQTICVTRGPGGHGIPLHVSNLETSIFDH